jgi:hypothetical protein
MENSKLTIYFNSLGHRYLSRLRHDFYKYLNIARDKKFYIRKYITEAQNYHLTVNSDAYQAKIIEIVQEGHNLQQSIDTMMPRILKQREHFYNQQWAGIEYNQDYYPVADLVEVTDPYEIVRFIIRYAVYMKLFADVFEPELKKLEEQQPEEQRPVELSPEQRTKEKQAVENIGKLVSGSSLPYTFKWIGKKPEQQVKKLYTLLTASGLIPQDTKPATFSKMFKAEAMPERVRWLGSNSLLLYLFNGLIHSGMVHVPEEIDQTLEVEEKTRNHI